MIPHIIYINLNRRTDRKEQIEQELNSFGLSYERFEAIEDNYGAVGCGLSHIEVLKIARDRNYENIIILEDDFTFLVSKEEFYNQLNNFFNLKLEYDACLLSYNLINSEQLQNNIVNKLLYAQTASGYIVNKKSYDKLINLFEYAMPQLKSSGAHWIFAIDVIWKNLQEQDNWYYFITRIGKQRDSYSDNSKQFCILPF